MTPNDTHFVIIIREVMLIADDTLKILLILFLTVALIVIFRILEASEKLIFTLELSGGSIILVILSVRVLQCPTERYQLIVVRIVELR